MLNLLKIWSENSNMIEIRYSKPEDLAPLTEIDNYYIQNSSITFDIHPKTPSQREQWFSKYKNDGPYRMLVATEDSKVIGCCYSSRYREHSAFDQTIETSIYLAHDCRAKGIGSKLYEKLFTLLKSEDLHLAVSGIALPNEASIRLHKKFGFTEVGVFEEYALKNNQYISSIWLQKKL